jgi:hypothetical protein
VTLNVYRTVGKTGTVTVSYYTSPDNAKPGVDYTPVSGVLTFGPGVYAQTVSIPLKNNAVPGSDVSFDLNLGTATGGATVGKPQFTTVLITHPSAPIVPPNPVGSQPPTVTGVLPVSGPQGIFAVILTFSKPMDPTRAQTTSNFAFYVTSPGGPTDLSVGVVSAAYDPSSRRVVLFLGAPVPKGGYGRLVAVAATSSISGRGLLGVSGTGLDGTGTGKSPGTSFVTIVR